VTNDPRDRDGSQLRSALHSLGRDAAIRAELIAFLRSVESRLDYDGSVRDEVTGPVVDALHDDDDAYEKTLSDGTNFRFLYRTKIAREFLLADEERPTHVWEPQTTKLVRHLASAGAGDVLVGGAYFGDHAILVASDIARRGARVHCFEPNRDQASMLVENARLNGLSNVVMNSVGLWSTSDAHLTLEGFDSFANAVETQPSDDSFPTVTIDDYCEQNGATIRLIQLDIEGGELEALRGAPRTLARDRPDVVFEVHRDYVDWSNGLQNADVCRLLAEAGYTLFAVRDFNAHREMGSKPVELVPADQVYLEGPPHGFNMLATQNTDLVDSPFFRVVPGVSPKLLAHRDPVLHHPIDGL